MWVIIAVIAIVILGLIFLWLRQSQKPSIENSPDITEGWTDRTGISGEQLRLIQSENETSKNGAVQVEALDSPLDIPSDERATAVDQINYLNAEITKLEADNESDPVMAHKLTLLKEMRTTLSKAVDNLQNFNK